MVASVPSQVKGMRLCRMRNDRSHPFRRYGRITADSEMTICSFAYKSQAKRTIKSAAKIPIVFKNGGLKFQ